MSQTRVRHLFLCTTSMTHVITQFVCNISDSEALVILVVVVVLVVVIVHLRAAGSQLPSELQNNGYMWWMQVTFTPLITYYTDIRRLC